MMSSRDKPLVWLGGEIKTPPMGQKARLEAGFLLRLLQVGKLLEMPHSRPMPGLGAHCHELRINDGGGTWRIFYRIDLDAILILDVVRKTTARTPHSVIVSCRRRLRRFAADSQDGD